MSVRIDDMALATSWTWAGNTGPAIGDERSPVPLRERIAAASKAGWQGVGLVYADAATYAADPGLDVVRTMLSDAGIERTELEFLSNWWAEGQVRDESDRVRRDLFEYAHLLGCTTIKVGAQLQAFGPVEDVEPERFADAFGALADDAARHGLRVAIEPMPMSNLTTIEAGKALIDHVDRPNAGLCVDIWHVARGGTVNERLPEILTTSDVFVVELDDAVSQVQGSLWDDTVNHRLLPGDGDLDAAGFVAAMAQIGWTGPWGCEVISQSYRERDVVEATAASRRAVRSVLDQARERLV